MSNDIAIRNNQPLGQNPAPEAQAPESLSERVYAAYARGIQSFIHLLFYYGWHFTGCALGTILLEPLSTLRAACEGIYYIFKRNYDFSDANPQELDQDQVIQHPILCLHGNYHSPAAFTGIASALANGNAPPLFTVSLNNGQITEQDTQIVAAKIQQIQDLYRANGVQDIRVNLIGHSRGGYIANQMSQSEGVHRVVVLGDDDGQDQPNVCKINGRLDCLLYRSADEVDQAAQRAAQNPNTHHLIEEGHLGLLYSPQAHALIAGWLNDGAPIELAPIGQQADPFEAPELLSE